MRDSITFLKSKEFAIRTVKMYQWLVDEKKEYILSKQCLKCGTSIGANLAEGMHGQSKADFIAKLHISLKEAHETLYWLELLKDTDYITTEMFQSVSEDCIELIKLLTSTIKTSKSR